MFHGDSEQLGAMESPQPKLMRILNLHYFMTFFFLPCVGQWGTKNRIAQNHLKCIAGERSLVIDNFLLSLQCGNSGVWGTKSEVSHNLILLVIYHPPAPPQPTLPTAKSSVWKGLKYNFESIVLVIYIRFKKYFPIGHHCKIQSDVLISKKAEVRALPPQYKCVP